jgi:hypothetical protein
MNAMPTLRMMKCAEFIKLALEDLIHTWLQPGVARPDITRKPFETVSNRSVQPATRLKPGVNEKGRPFESKSISLLRIG